MKLQRTQRKQRDKEGNHRGQGEKGEERYRDNKEERWRLRQKKTYLNNIKNN